MNQTNKQTIDYVVLGHVTRDRTDDGFVPGGTVTYAGRLADALGCRTAVITSARPDYELSDIYSTIELALKPSEEDSIFVNRYSGNQREQWLTSRADDIEVEDVPTEWQNAAIVHFGPLTNEINPVVLDLFPNSLVGVTPQGWMRRWDDRGRVYATRFPAEEAVLSKATATVISEEDLVDETMLDDYIRWSNLLVMTENYAGCKVFFDGRVYQVPAPEIELIEPTGAGDIFAGAFFVQLWRNGGDPIEAAEFANFVAAHSVTQVKLEDKVNAWRKAEPPKAFRAG